jgi:hypothetical protein
MLITISDKDWMEGVDDVVRTEIIVGRMGGAKRYPSIAVAQVG